MVLIYQQQDGVFGELNESEIDGVFGFYCAALTVPTAATVATIEIKLKVHSHLVSKNKIDKERVSKMIEITKRREAFRKFVFMFVVLFVCLHNR